MWRKIGSYVLMVSLCGAAWWAHTHLWLTEEQAQEQAQEHAN
jgi:hypothetical protein